MAEMAAVGMTMLNERRRRELQQCGALHGRTGHGESVVHRMIAVNAILESFRPGRHRDTGSPIGRALQVDFASPCASWNRPMSSTLRSLGMKGTYIQILNDSILGSWAVAPGQPKYAWPVKTSNKPTQTRKLTQGGLSASLAVSPEENSYWSLNKPYNRYAMLVQGERR